ncbi:hypothetical protein LTR86_011296 [Recurvomyces mirabilis]|nr:hypothetical protein LTR86_011296 [Recurvomyces mirabilis]
MELEGWTGKAYDGVYLTDFLRIHEVQDAVIDAMFAVVQCWSASTADGGAIVQNMLLSFKMFWMAALIPKTLMFWNISTCDNDEIISIIGTKFLLFFFIIDVLEYTALTGCPDASVIMDIMRCVPFDSIFSLLMAGLLLAFMISKE